MIHYYAVATSRRRSVNIPFHFLFPRAAMMLHIIWFTVSFVFICISTQQVQVVSGSNVFRRAYPQDHQDEDERIRVVVQRSSEPRQRYSYDAGSLVGRSWSPRRIYSQMDNKENNIFERDRLENGTRKRKGNKTV
jgi:hypothetical protein